MFTLAKILAAQLHVPRSKDIQVNGFITNIVTHFINNINMNIINVMTDHLDMKLREITDTLKVL